MQNVSLRIEADRNESVTVSEFARDVQNQAPPPAASGPRERERVVIANTEPHRSPARCLAFCMNSASARAALRDAERTGAPPPARGLFCRVW